MFWGWQRVWMRDMSSGCRESLTFIYAKAKLKSVTTCCFCLDFLRLLRDGESPIYPLNVISLASMSFSFWTLKLKSFACQCAINKRLHASNCEPNLRIIIMHFLRINFSCWRILCKLLEKKVRSYLELVL